MTAQKLLRKVCVAGRIKRGFYTVVCHATKLEAKRPLILQDVTGGNTLYIVKSSTRRPGTRDPVLVKDCGSVYIIHDGIYRMQALDKITFISAGPGHKAVIDDCHRLYTWGGSNAFGALGHMRGGSVVGLVDGLVDVATVCCGGTFTVALDTGGRLFAWGAFLHGSKPSISLGQPNQPVAMSARLRSGEVFVQIAVGFAHFLALTSQGRVFSCGLGEQHQLGRTVCNRNLNQRPQLESIGLANVKGIACGYFNSFAIDNNGIVWVWGLNDQGQTGIPPKYRQTKRDGELIIVSENEIIEKPTAVEGLNKKVVHISSAKTHSVFVFEDGSIKCVGVRVTGVDTHGLLAVKSVVASEDAYLVLTADDRIFKYMIGTVRIDIDSDSILSQDDSGSDGEENGSDDADSDSTAESSNPDIQTGNRTMNSGWEELEYPFKPQAIAIGMVLGKDV